MHTSTTKRRATLAFLPSSLHLLLHAPAAGLPPASAGLSAPFSLHTWQPAGLGCSRPLRLCISSCRHSVGSAPLTPVSWVICGLAAPASTPLGWMLFGQGLCFPAGLITCTGVAGADSSEEAGERAIACKGGEAEIGAVVAGIAGRLGGAGVQPLAATQGLLLGGGQSTVGAG